MSDYQKLQEILIKIAETGIVEDSDIEIINEGVNSDKKMSFQVGKNLINIGKGEGIHIGDRIYYQWDEEAIKVLANQIQSENINNSKITIHLEHSGSGDNVNGNKIINNYSSSSDSCNLDIDWQEMSQVILEEYQRLTTNPLTVGEGIFHDKSDRVYVPLGLVERKKKPRSKKDISPEEGSELYQETEITQKFKNTEFLEQVIQKGQTPKSQGKRIAIIGEPGAGKTTLLQQIAQWIINQIEDAIVIWVSLADLQGQELESYLQEKWLQAFIQKLGQAEVTTQIENDFVSQFQQKKIWLLLDGVDEMPTTSGNPLSDISRQVRQGGLLSQAKIILTCRLNLWDGNYNSLDTFDTYRTLEFSYPEQVEQFIDNWFNALPSTEKNTADKLCNALKQQGKERIRDLVKNPLRLTLLCFNWHLREGNLPETKAGLYEQFVDDFYVWKKDKFVTTGKQRKELNKALGKLAKEAIDKEETRFRLRKEFVVEYLGEPDDENSLFSLALKLGWLNRVGVDIDNPRKAVYAFFHASFQEYFAALAINDWDYFLNHIPENPNHPDANYRIFEPEWKEVILLWFGLYNVKGLPQQKEEILNTLIEFEDVSEKYGFYGKQAYLLASLCIGECQENYSNSSDIINTIIKWAFGYFDSDKQKWGRYSYKIEKQARDALMGTNHQLAISILSSTIPIITDNLTALNAIEFLYKIAPYNPIILQTIKKLIKIKEDKFICQQALKFWWDIDPNNDILIQKIVEIDSQDALGNRELRVKIKNYDRDVAIDIFTKLTQLAKANLNRFDAAIRLVELDNNNSIAIEALIKFLRNCDTKNTDSMMIAESVSHWIGKIGCNNLKVIEKLEETIYQTQNEFIKAQSAIALKRVNACNPKAIETLEELINKGQNTYVLWKVAKYLGTISPNHKVAIKTVEDLIEKCKYEKIRLHLAWDLWNINPHNSITVNILSELIKSTQDNFTLGLAIRYLTKIDKERVIKILEELAKASVNDTILLNLANELFWICPQHKLIISLMENLAKTSQDIFTRYSAAKKLLEICPQNQIAINSLLQIICINEIEINSKMSETEERFYSIQGNTVTQLENILENKDYTMILRAHRNRISDKKGKINSDSSITSYNIVWSCVSKMSYPEFYDSWKK